MGNDSLTEILFDLHYTLFSDFFHNMEKPWEILNHLEANFSSFIEHLPAYYHEWKPNIWIAENVSIAPTACIQGPSIIGSGTEIRHGAFLRQNVIVGNHCVIGNSSEVKNALLFDGCKFRTLTMSVIQYWVIESI